MSAHRYGALPDDKSVPRVRLADHVSVDAESLPKSVNWGKIPTIGMLLNNELGDCVFASDGHICEILSYWGQGTEVVVTDDVVETAYEKAAGYDPNAPLNPDGSNPTDRGAQLTQGLGYLVTTGMQGVKIDAYAEIDVRNIVLLKTALAELGPVDLALAVPASAEQQTAEGQPWSYVGDMNILGGHCVTGVGYDDDYLYIHTWGQVQAVEWEFFSFYFDQAFALVSREWVNAKSTLDPEHVDLQTLGEEFASITGQANPFAPAKKGCPILRVFRSLGKLFHV